MKGFEEMHFPGRTARLTEQLQAEVVVNVLKFSGIKHRIRGLLYPVVHEIIPVLPFLDESLFHQGLQTRQYGRGTFIQDTAELLQFEMGADAGCYAQYFLYSVAELLHARDQQLDYITNDVQLPDTLYIATPPVPLRIVGYQAFMVQASKELPDEKGIPQGFLPEQSGEFFPE
jgi:hypothetical protein